MKNIYIIASAKEMLYKQGVLKLDENGFIEEIHTFVKWKELGYIVKQGEKHRCKITIWKHSKRRIDEEGNVKPSKMFLGPACFFTREQVTEIK